MARKTKEGLDYHPWDVDSDKDKKLARVIAENPDYGELVHLKLCGWIYKEGGYRLLWTEEEQTDFYIRIAYIRGVTVAIISDVVRSCLKWKLFDNVIYEECQTLTSKRIQSTWWEATRKRKNRMIENRICLLTPEEMGFPAPEMKSNALTPEEMPINSGSYQQSKVNESKVNNNNSSMVVVPMPPFSFESPSLPPYLSLEENRKIALADRAANGFLETFARVGLMPELLGRWLDAFHRFLSFKGEALKQQENYRRHFADWLKFRQYRTTLPEDYSPVEEPVDGKKNNDKPGTLKTGINHL